MRIKWHSYANIIPRPPTFASFKVYRAIYWYFGRNIVFAYECCESACGGWGCGGRGLGGVPLRVEHHLEALVVKLPVGCKGHQEARHTCGKCQSKGRTLKKNGNFSVKNKIIICLHTKRRQSVKKLKIYRFKRKKVVVQLSIVLFWQTYVCTLTACLKFLSSY